MRVRAFAVLIAAGAMLCGCDLLSKAEDAAADAGINLNTDGGNPIALDCTKGTNLGSVITGQHSTAQMPTPQGGTPTDGVYLRTATTYYEYGDNGPDSSTFQGTLVIAGNTVLNINHAFPDPEERVGGTWTVAGTNLALTVTCSSSGQGIGQTMPMPFSFQDGVLKTYDPNSKKESVYTKQ